LVLIGDVLQLSLTFGRISEIDAVLLNIWLVLTFWSWLISSILWTAIERINSRRMDRLKRLIDEMEKSETWKYVKSNAPPYVLADSVDRSLLGAIYEFWGDYLSVSTKLYKSALPGNPDTVNNLLAKLYLLGLIDFDWEYEHIILTSMGVDAVHIPVSLFMTRLPFIVNWTNLDTRVTSSQDRHW